MIDVWFDFLHGPVRVHLYTKEFPLFQISWDTWFSFLIRGCWMVSFLFTPLYMFMLVQLSLFGVKRSTLGAYKSVFEYDFGMNRIVIYWYPRKFTGLPYIPSDLQMWWQVTAFCSQLSTLIFFCVWLSYWFYGEALLSIVFSLRSPMNMVNSPNYFTTQENPISQLISFSFITLSSLYGSVNFFSVVLFKHKTPCFMKPLKIC
jgi:hypothetical protein